MLLPGRPDFPCCHAPPLALLLPCLPPSTILAPPLSAPPLTQPGQVADWFARKGVLVVLADVLGAPPDSVNGDIQKQGLAPAGYKGTNYWPIHR